MPQVSQFFGISIYMYYDEHNPPHFHAIYGKNEGQIGISPLALIEGKLSGRVLGLAMEWAALHQKQLFGELGTHAWR